MKSIQNLKCAALCMLLTALLEVSGCSSSGDEQLDHFFRVTSEEGVPVAITSSVPRFEGLLFDYEELLWLEQDEERPETLLTGPTRFIMGDDGRYYTPDYRDCSIYVFDEEGLFVRKIGREGDGPGEFRSPNLLWVENGELAVYDLQLMRTGIFTTDGQFLEYYSYPAASYSANAIYPLNDSRLVIVSNEVVSSTSEEMLLKYTVIVVSSDGDTLGALDSPPFSLGRRIRIPRYNTSVSATVYFGPRSYLTYCHGIGLLSYDTAEPVIKWYDMEARLCKVIRIEMEPEPVTDEERRGINQYLQTGIDEAADERRMAQAEARKKHAVIPDYKSYWSGVTVDDAGYHWISRHYDYTVPREDYIPTYMLLSPEGEYLGDVQHPVSPAWVTRGHLMTYQEDEETGELTFIVYRMIPAVEGFVYPQ